MKTIMRVVECGNHETAYGFLEVYDVTAEEVQREIYSIKNDKDFLEAYPDWTVEDVFTTFPAEWRWIYTPADCVVEI